MIPYGRHDIREEDIEGVVDVLRSDWLTQGPMVPQFEGLVAQYTGAKFGVAVNSASSALHIACLALGLGPGDWFWTCPNTFVASVSCGLHCGASVDFVDMDPRTYNMSVDSLSEKLEVASIEGKLPKVVIPVHYAGQSCEMVKISALSKKYGFKIIEDASHAIGGRYRGQPVGAGIYSDITVFSFHPVKIITSGEGGMAVTNSDELANRMRRFRSHGLTSEPQDMVARLDSEIWNYQQIGIGFNYRMTDIHAALGVTQIRRLDEYVAKRSRIAQRYDELLSELPCTLPKQHVDTNSSFHLYPIRVHPRGNPKKQREVYEACLAAKVWVNIHYIPVHRQPYFEAMGFRAGYCPEAESFHRETISLPIFPRLSVKDQSYVLEVIRGALL